MEKVVTRMMQNIHSTLAAMGRSVRIGPLGLPFKSLISQLGPQQQFFLFVANTLDWKTRELTH